MSFEPGEVIDHRFVLPIVGGRKREWANGHKSTACDSLLWNLVKGFCYDLLPNDWILES